MHICVIVYTFILEGIQLSVQVSDKIQANKLIRVQGICMYADNINE